MDDLDEILGVEIEDDEVDSVGGLMAKHLGKVPIPGSTVEVAGLRFLAEEAKGRRNRVGTVLITPSQAETWPASTTRALRVALHAAPGSVTSLPLDSRP